MSEENEVFTPYDTADYLTSRQDAAAYLEAAIEEAGDDPAFIAQALGTVSAWFTTRMPASNPSRGQSKSVTARRCPDRRPTPGNA